LITPIVPIVLAVFAGIWSIRVYQGKDPFFQKHIGLMAIFLPDGVNSVMRLSNSLRTAGTKASRALRRGVLAFSLATTTLALPVLAIAPGDGSSELAIVPAGSAVVIHLKGVLGTKDRLLAYLEKAVPDQAAIAKTFIDQATSLEQVHQANRTFKGNRVESDQGFFARFRFDIGEDFLLVINKKISRLIGGASHFRHGEQSQGHKTREDCTLAP
jgi:hypothetical protein